jgi:hypothetical protein
VSADTSPSDDLWAPLERLLTYCRTQDWAGFDPYDALNSRVFSRTPLVRSRWCRIAATQILKRLPFNPRPLLGISPEQNPKGIALFLSTLVKLSRMGRLTDEHLVDTMVDRLIALRSPNTAYWCWGYSFPWQTRTVLVPRGAPNLVCCSFVANALLDYYGSRNDQRALDMAVSAADYIRRELYWADGTTIGFSYPMPGERTQVHNANFLAAALLCRIYRHTGDNWFLEPALKAARCSAAAQAANGSWSYGQSSTQRWIDNFHTGYNLCALQSIGRDAGTTEFESRVILGFDYYRANFFDDSGAPKYFHDRQYPIDAHCIAQSIITLLAFRARDERHVALASSILSWAIAHMWDERGYFYYQVLASGTNRVSYMRWTQAWMALALATLMEQAHITARTSQEAVA